MSLWQTARPQVPAHWPLLMQNQISEGPFCNSRLAAIGKVTQILRNNPKQNFI